MLFMSPVGIDLLKQSKVWYADGTFSTAPVPYAQVYIVFGNTSEGKVLPCDFGVLSSKQTVTYRSFWTQIKLLIDSGIQQAYSLNHLIVDFDTYVGYREWKSKDKATDIFSNSFFFCCVFSLSYLSLLSEFHLLQPRTTLVSSKSGVRCSWLGIPALKL